MKDSMGFDTLPGRDWRDARAARKKMKEDEDEDVRPRLEARRKDKR